MSLARNLRQILTSIPHRPRLGAAIIALPCFGVVAAFGIAPDTMIERPPLYNVVEQLSLPQFAALEDDSAAVFIREERIQRGDTVASLLARLFVDDPSALQFLRTTKQVRALHQLIPGRSVQAATTAEGKLLRLRYLNAGDLLAIDREEDRFVVKSEPAQLEQRTLMTSAQIRSSLFGATDAAGLPDTVALQIAEIFSTDIDFHTDLRKGDRFSVVYEAFYHRGELVKTGRVVAAEFVNQGRAYHAAYFTTAPNEGSYYTLDGKNLRKQFLRSPLEFSRITSGFTHARFHPVLQQWRAHKGVDYGAPSGRASRQPPMAPFILQDGKEDTAI